MKRTLLIVDDDTDLLDVLTTLFTAQGYDVAAATSGKEALEILDRKTARVALIDYRMPGMDGLELCRRLKARNPASLAIAMSGYLQVFSLVDVREAGFDDMIEKPFELDALKTLVDDAFTRMQRWLKLGLKKDGASEPSREG